MTGVVKGAVVVERTVVIGSTVVVRSLSESIEQSPPDW
jgi:hypothetical protein